MSERADRGAVVVVALAIALLATGSEADEIELTNGKTYRGLVEKRDSRYVVFKAVIGSGTAEMMFPAGMVKSVKVDGKMPQPAPAPTPARQDPLYQQPTPAGRPQAAANEIPKSPGADAGNTLAAGGGPATSCSPAQVNAMIAKAGGTVPDWWDSVELDYPSTLDLMGTHRARGWAPQHNLGAYFYSIISPNPRRWRQGIKVFDHCVKARQKSPATLPEAMAQLARGYMRFEKDWARAAYWYRRMLDADPRGRSSVFQATRLAECYWELGSKPLAAGMLRKYRLDRVGTGPVVRLWGRMGQMKQAMDLAEWMAGRGGGVPGYSAAADVARRAGKLAEAQKLFRKAVDAGNALPGNRRPVKYIHSAEEAADALRIFAGLDMSRLRDGTYKGSSDTGYRGPVEVEVVVKAGRIDSARVARHKEDMAFTAIKDIPASFVARQGLAGVDTVTSATVSSEAILGAAVKALAGAAK